MSGELAWVDGSFDGAVHASDRGLPLGDGVFDTLVAVNGVPFAGERHLRRLIAQAAAIDIAFEAERVSEGWAAVLARAGGSAVILRTTVTRGRTERGLWPAGGLAQPTLIVTTSPWNTGMIGRPVRLVTSTVARNAGSPLSRLKTLNYLDSILAAREAAERGADDALFVNGAGRIACTTIANVFAVFGDRLVTPPAADGVMAGIMRSLVLEASSASGLRAEEASLSTAELAGADAVFTTNSVRFLSPVTGLDGRAFGSLDHPATENLNEKIAPAPLRGCKGGAPA